MAPDYRTKKCGPRTKKLSWNVLVGHKVSFMAVIRAWKDTVMMNRSVI